MTKEQYLDDIFSKTTIIADRNYYYSSSIYFKTGDRIYMRYDTKNGNLWCEYINIWSVLLHKYLCSNLEISELIRGMVEQHFKLNVVTPFDSMPMTHTLAEQHYKNI